MQCRDLYSTGVQGSLWAQMERSHVQTTPCLACRLSYAAALDPPSSSPAGLTVKFTHHSATTEKRITSNSHSNFLPLKCGLQLLEVWLFTTPG